LWLFILSLQNQSIATNGEPNPELVKRYTEMMAGKTELNLISQRISDAEVQALAEALKNNKSLTWLLLVGNQIVDTGALYLSEALMVNTTLTKLCLGANRIDTTGLQALAKALKMNKTLTELSYSGNRGSDHAVRMEIDRQVEINKRLPEVLRANWSKIKHLFIGYGDAGSLLSTLPKEVILNIIGTVLDLEALSATKTK